MARCRVRKLKTEDLLAIGTFMLETKRKGWKVTAERFGGKQRYLTWCSYETQLVTRQEAEHFRAVMMGHGVSLARVEHMLGRGWRVAMTVNLRG